jgi:hypothetical protein
MIKSFEASDDQRRLGVKLTKNDFEKACEEQDTYRQFILTHLFDQDTVMVIPGRPEDAMYRDIYSE